MHIWPKTFNSLCDKLQLHLSEWLRQSPISSSNSTGSHLVSVWSLWECCKDAEGGVVGWERVRHGWPLSLLGYDCNLFWGVLLGVHAVARCWDKGKDQGVGGRAGLSWVAGRMVHGRWNTGPPILVAVFFLATSGLTTRAALFAQCTGVPSFPIIASNLTDMGIIVGLYPWLAHYWLWDGGTWQLARCICLEGNTGCMGAYIPPWWGRVGLGRHCLPPQDLVPDTIQKVCPFTQH